MKAQNPDKQKITMLQKIGYLFDRKQKMQFIGLGVLILIGGLLETLGVSMMVPVVQGIMDPAALTQNEIVGKVLGILNIEIPDMPQDGGNRLIIMMLAVMMVLFIVKNAYLLFQT
ncbi:MAG: ABC transporter ATP-binding protein, partial [Lachnospiraceae bacterium]|nr:ABC transporter ATP-binding protein [Lachnospiraceae bacterium]